MPTQPRTANVKQPITDDSIKVRHLSHYQFSWTAQEPGQAGVLTLQLVLDQGAWEEVLTVSAEDAEVLRGLLGGPLPRRVRRHTQDVDPTRTDLHHEEHIQPAQQHGAHVQEVTRQQTTCLGGQERFCCVV